MGGEADCNWNAGFSTIFAPLPKISHRHATLSLLYKIKIKMCTKVSKIEHCVPFRTQPNDLCYVPIQTGRKRNWNYLAIFPPVFSYNKFWLPDRQFLMDCGILRCFFCTGKWPNIVPA